jgi:hypothetical protein
MSLLTTFKFHQGSNGYCAALAAYWIHLMESGEASQVRAGKIRDYVCGKDVLERTKRYTNACLPRLNTPLGAVRTAFTPLAPKGMQPCNPRKRDHFGKAGIVELVGYIDKNSGHGVLFTFVYKCLFGPQAHTVAFWKDGRTAYMFDADYGEFRGEPTGDMIRKAFAQNYSFTDPANFTDCYFAHMRSSHS